MKREELDNLFGSRKMSVDTLRRRNAIETIAYELAEAIYNFVPDSREQSLAFTKLEEAIMWANKGLSKYGE